MPGQYVTPWTYIWRVLRLHNDAGGLCVLLNNQMAGSSGRRELFYFTYVRHHRHWPKIRRNLIASREGPAGNLPQYTPWPPTNIWESHRSSIPFSTNDKHRHGKERILQRQTTSHYWTPQETVWNTKLTRDRPGTPPPPWPNVLQPSAGGDALQYWGGPNVPHGASRWRPKTQQCKCNQLRDD